MGTVIGLIIFIFLAMIWIDDLAEIGCSIFPLILIVAIVVGLIRGAIKHEAEHTTKTYTAIVRNTDGSEHAYDNVKSYETKDNTMTLTLKDGTKVFVPITNITINEHTDESTTETTVETTTVETTESK